MKYEYLSYWNYICVWFCTLRLGLHELAFHSERQYFKELLRKDLSWTCKGWAKGLFMVSSFSTIERVVPTRGLIYICSNDVHSFFSDGLMTKNDFVKYRGDWIEVGNPRSSWGRSTWGFIHLRNRTYIRSLGHKIFSQVSLCRVALNCITTYIHVSHLPK